MPDAESERILIVDDEPIVGESFRKLFDEEEYEIDIALGGKEAIEKVRGHDYDLVITDLRMPDLDGISMLEQIRGEQPDAALLMITGYASVDTATQAMKLGAFDYIEKPFTPEEIRAAVQKALKQKRFLDRKDEQMLDALSKTELKTTGFDDRTPAAVADTVTRMVGVQKVRLPLFNLGVLGILAGVYIGFGAALATLVGHDAAQYIGLGLTQIVVGGVFSVGLMLVVIAGAELFTGNNLMMASFLGGEIKVRELLEKWAIVYVANFAGSMLLVWIIYGTGLWRMGELGVGVKALAIANAKANLSFGEALFRGIGCNWLVCLAVWMAATARQTVSKIFAIFFPIMAFVALGFEHCVANMYFIPLGLLLKATEVFAASGLIVTSLTWGNFVVRNLIPVTIGNIIGGALFVGALYWSVYVKGRPRRTAV